MEEQKLSGEEYCAVRSLDNRKQFVIKQMFAGKKMTVWEWDRELIRVGLVDRPIL